MSRVPSLWPVKFPTAIAFASSPEGSEYVSPAVKPPEPLLSRIARVEELTTAMSTRPLPVKSPEAVPTTMPGEETLAAVKPPAPSLAMICAELVLEASAQVLPNRSVRRCRQGTNCSRSPAGLRR